MPNYWPRRCVLRWMSVVRNHEIRNMVLLSTFSLLLTCFLFWISLWVWYVYDWKNYCIGYLYTQTSQIDCFRLVHKILRWIGSSDFKSKVVNIYFKYYWYNYFSLAFGIAPHLLCQVKLKLVQWCRLKEIFNSGRYTLTMLL